MYQGPDESLARPGMKQATVTELFNFCKPFKNNSEGFPVQPGLRGSNDLCIRWKMATFQLFFQSGRAKDLSVPL